MSLCITLSLSLSHSDVHISFGLQWLNGTVLKLSWSISPFLSAIIKDDTAFVVEWRKRNNKTLPLSSSSSSSWSSSDVLWSITEQKVHYYVVWICKSCHMQLVYFVLPIFPRSIHFNLLLFYTHGNEKCLSFLLYEDREQKGGNN